MLIRSLFQNFRGHLISRISAVPSFRGIKFRGNSRIWPKNTKSAKFNPNKVIDAVDGLIEIEDPVEGAVFSEGTYETLNTHSILIPGLKIRSLNEKFVTG